MSTNANSQRARQELANLRNRRRRQRQRRAARRRLLANNNNGRNTNNRYRRNVEHENKASEESKEEIQTVEEELKVGDILDDATIKFCEAVVHPFGNDAVGATLPDKYQELVIPVSDRLELDISPAFFKHPLSESDPPASAKLLGIFVWFQPRCIAVGQTVYGAPNAAATDYTNRAPYSPVFDATNPDEQEDLWDGILNAYNLCITGMWEYQSVIRYGFWMDDSSQFANILPQYFFIPYTRFQRISANCDKLRILGAGIKMWSEQAPINTGGYSVGGWITLEDIYTALNTNLSTGLQQTTGALYGIQTSIKYACRSPGVKGQTVRYSCLQTAEQLEPEYPKPPGRLYTVRQNIATTAVKDISSPFLLEDQDGADLAIDDLITPGSYVPCIFWAYNVVDSTSSENVSQQYTIKLMSMVHSEGTPTGQCPFMATKSQYDPSTEHMKMILENPEVYPAATKGNSFKSFMKRARHIVVKAAKHAGKISKVIALADKMLF